MKIEEIRNGSEPNTVEATFSFKPLYPLQHCAIDTDDALVLFVCKCGHKTEQFIMKAFENGLVCEECGNVFPIGEKVFCEEIDDDWDGTLVVRQEDQEEN